MSPLPPPLPLAAVVATSADVARLPGRLAKRDALAACLRGCATPDDMEIAAAWLGSEPRQRRLGIGPALLFAQRDAGAADESTLSVAEVDARLAELGAIRGAGSASARAQQLRALLAQATAEEQDFLTRLLLGELRQGALQGVMIDAVAQVAGVAPAAVRRAAMLAGALPPVARALAERGAAAVAGTEMQPLQPVQPMLAQPAADIADAMARLGTAALDWKLDGARVQVHKLGDVVRVHTRNLNDVTAQVPEIVEAMRALPADALILDGEAIGLQPDGRPLAFQATMSRFSSRLDVQTLRAATPLTVLFFDCLHAEGRAWIDRPASERFDALARVVPPALRVPRLITSDVAAGEAFCADAIARGHEGVMAKSLDAPYEAGSRGAGWFKIKRAHTLDLVVLAAEWGHGRRRGWLSNLHLGARDAESGGWVMLGKTFKGMTDALLEWQTAELLARATRRDGHVVEVRPELVVEIAFNDVQDSPHYPGGVALRFARVKGYRPDKRADEADTIETVRRLRMTDGEEPR